MKGQVLRLRILPNLVFQLAIGLWMFMIAHGDSNAANGINMTVLNVIFGSKH